MMILMILFALHVRIMSDVDETTDEFVSCEESKTKKVSKIILNIQ